MCPYAGIALGPESEEGVVRVNGALLQAGRVLPLTATSYQIERVLGRVLGADPGDPHALPSVGRLEVLLFESPHELGACVARANGRHEASVVVASDVVWTEVVRVPFAGRRAALLALVAAAPGAGSHAARVVGRRFSVSRQVVEEFLLVEDEPFSPSADRLALVLGGTDEAELYHELVVYMRTGDGVAVAAHADVETVDQEG